MSQESMTSGAVVSSYTSANGRKGPDIDDKSAALIRELHDSVLQHLLYLSLELSSLDSQLPSQATSLRNRATGLAQIAHDSYEQLRVLITRRKPAKKDSCSLADLLVACLQSFMLKTGVTVKADLGEAVGNEWISSFMARHVEAIMNEALWNAWKHAGLGPISISLEEEGDNIRLTIADEGCGFDPGVKHEGHFGLCNMRERAEAVGASFKIDSALNKGTSINIVIPKHRLGSNVD